MTKRRKHRSQPRIPGTSRLPSYSGMLEAVRSGLMEIADREGRSLSWVVAEIVADYFGIDAKTGKLLRVASGRKHAA